MTTDRPYVAVSAPRTAWRLYRYCRSAHVTAHVSFIENHILYFGDLNTDYYVCSDISKPFTQVRLTHYEARCCFPVELYAPSSTILWIVHVSSSSSHLSFHQVHRTRHYIAASLFNPETQQATAWPCVFIIYCYANRQKPSDSKWT